MEEDVQQVEPNHLRVVVGSMAFRFRNKDEGPFTEVGYGPADGSNGPNFPKRTVDSKRVQARAKLQAAGHTLLATV